MTEIPQAPAPPPSEPPAPAAQKQGNGQAVAGMVLGIVGVAMFCVWYIALPCAIVGLILSILGRKKAQQTGVGVGMAKAGLILCIIALALDIFGAIFLTAIIFGALGVAKEAAEQAEQAMLVIQSFLA